MLAVRLGVGCGGKFVFVDAARKRRPGRVEEQGTPIGVRDENRHFGVEWRSTARPDENALDVEPVKRVYERVKLAQLEDLGIPKAPSVPIEAQGNADSADRRQHDGQLV